MSGYDRREYWDAVGAAITKRPSADRAVAGDDSPVQRYKRKKFLKALLASIPAGASVLEVGSGPGENLGALKAAGSARRLAGADIAPSMIALARARGHEIFPIDGQSLPFADGEFDVVFSATVLQHNRVFEAVLGEMCRVAASRLFLFEDTVSSGPTLDYGTYLRRSVNHYVAEAERHGFQLVESVPLGIFASEAMQSGLMRLFDDRKRREAEPLPKRILTGEAALLTITRRLDGHVSQRRGMTKIAFERV